MKFFDKNRNVSNFRSTHNNHQATNSYLALFSLPILFVAQLGSAAPAIIPRAQEINATSFVLLDAKTGRVIVEENADEALPPASLTKIMTSYIAIEEIMNGRLQLDDQIHISEKAWRMEGSKTFVGVDTQVQAEDLLRGIIIQSGNDASVAIAEHIAGSEEAFADMMNQYADAIGLEQSFFMNASGLDTELYYNTMSARDLSILARETITRHADFYPMYAEREFTYNGITQPNRNTLLFRDRNVDGMKTGWTDAAGYCLVASAERDGMRLISVVMGTASEQARAVETQKLFTYGFRYFQTYKLYYSEEVLTNLPVSYGEKNAVDLGIQEEAYITIPRGQGESLDASIEISETIEAPLSYGELIGVVNVRLNDDLLFAADVVAMEDVPRGNLFKRFIDWITLLFSGLFSE